MKVMTTSIEGVLLLEPQLFEDERGWFYETWREQDYRQYGIKESFVQDNVSLSKKNVIRGLHYQQGQGQLVWVSQGHIFDVIVDIRPESPTFNQYVSFDLEGEKPRQLYMPPGCAHGFCVLSDYAVVHYKCSQYYDPATEGRLAWDDPKIGIQWPCENPMLSQMDDR